MKRGRILFVELVVGEEIINVIIVYVTQVGLNGSTKKNWVDIE